MASSSKKILLRNKIRAMRGLALLGCLQIIKQIFAAPFFRRIFWQLLSRLVRQTQLFDVEYYLAANEDVAQLKKTPLRHYVAYGDKEGRMPLPLFEPVFYRLHCHSKFKSINALLHYAYVGRYLQAAPGPWFDLGHYLTNNKDVARSGQDPLLHYLRYGGLEGRSPSPQFDSAHYLRENPDVLASRINPLLHYIRFGRYERRRTHPVVVETSLEPESSVEQVVASLPAELDWKSLDRYADVPTAVVDVIVPVYRGRAETLRCLYSLLSSSCQTAYEVIVINDASPDGELVADLEHLADKGYFSLRTNQENVGFVRTVNLGMKLHPQRDVILLNSDTEVYGDWLDRLRKIAQRTETTGTVTPLSNNATICSYPRFLHDNPYPLEIDYAELDRLTARVNAGFEVEAPTGVGFCLYIKRSCLAEVGLFDEEVFDKGYGEENDFCQRAIAKGWRNIIATEVFVRHWGAVSFLGQKEKRVQNALKILEHKHPDYHKDVQHFIACDPLALARTRIDSERLKQYKRMENVLIVSHSRGGGSERHVQEDVERLLREGKGVFFLRPQQGASEYAAVSHPVTKILPNLSPFPLADTQSFIQLLRELAISEIHTHGLVDFSPQSPEYLIRAVKELNLHLEVNIHDYKVICPRINLVDDQGFYCGEKSIAHCDDCLKTFGSDFSVISIESWRALHHRFLLAADRVLVPDIDVAERLERYYLDVAFEVSPHEEIDPVALSLRQPELSPGENLLIVIIGAVGKIKGFDVLLNCARDAKVRGVPLKFILMGYSMNDRLLEEAGVLITGKYRDEDAVEILTDLDSHLVWLPSTWPETYSYTLSIAQQVGVPVVSFDVGAISRRVKAYDPAASDRLLPLEWGKKPRQINDRFIDLRTCYTVADVSEFQDS